MYKQIKNFKEHCEIIVRSYWDWYLFKEELVREIKKIGEEEWKKVVYYGKRWLIEIFFSKLKRVVGEIIRAKKDGYKFQEVLFKIYSYLIMRNYNGV